MRPLRVLHVVPRLFGAHGVYGGGERFAYELARTMAGRTPVRLAGFGSRSPAGDDGALQVRALRNWLPGRRFALNPLGPGLLPQLQWADVVHCHQTYTLATSLSLLYARAAAKPIFTSDLGGGGVCLHNLLDVSAWFQGHLHISQFSQSAAGARAGDRIIFAGVDTARFRPHPHAVRDGTVLFVGRIMAHKGIDYLIAAVDAATPLRIIGRPYEPEYFERLRRLAAGKRVTFVTDAEEVDIIAACQRASCLVLPSVERTADGRLHPVTELFGMVLIEAMACATPVICTAVGAMPEVVEDGVSGFIVPPNDAAAIAAKIDWLRQHPQAAEAMGRAARRRVLDQFTWAGVVDRCLDAYTAACTATGARTRHSSAGAISTR